MPCKWQEVVVLSFNGIARDCETASQTWQYMIFPQSSETQKRCCYLCGIFCRDKHHNILTEEVEHFLNMQSVDEVFHRVYSNVLDSSNLLHCAMNSKFHTLGLCYFCYFWMQRKNKSKRGGCLLPLQLLRRHINTLQKYKKRLFDSRILWYLCQSLCSYNETTGYNYYFMCLFEHEKNIVRDIYTHGKSSIKYILAKHYALNNRGALFIKNIRIAQFLREHLRSDKSDETFSLSVCETGKT